MIPGINDTTLSKESWALIQYSTSFQRWAEHKKSPVPVIHTSILLKPDNFLLLLRALGTIVVDTVVVLYLFLLCTSR